MKILSLGFDHTIAQVDADVVGDSRSRHLAYTDFLRHAYPGSVLHILAHAPTSSKRENVSERGLTVQTIPSNRSMFAFHAYRIGQRLLRDSTFDLVMTQTPFDDGYVGLRLARQAGIPCLVQMHSSFIDNRAWIAEKPFIYHMFNALGKRVLRQADLVRVVSHGEKARLADILPAVYEKTIVLTPWISADRFSRENDDDEMGDAVLIQEGLRGTPYILFAGRLVYQKELPVLLDAFKLVAVKTQDAVLAIAGEGPLRAALETQARGLGIDARLRWLGNVSQPALRTLYENAACLALPSCHEGYGSVIVEANLSGTACIVTPFISAQELVQDEVTGFIIPFGDRHALADRLTRLLENPTTARTMGAAARDAMLAMLPDEETYLASMTALWAKAAELPASTQVK